MAEDTTAPRYWLNWRFLLCAIWVSAVVVFSVFSIWKNERSKKSGKQSSKDQQESAQLVYCGDAWSTCSKSIHPIWLLVYRIISLGVLLALILADAIVHSPGIFFFYTQWTFSLVVVYFALASALSIYGYRHSERDDRAGADTEEGAVCGNNRHVTVKSTSSVLFLGHSLQVLFQVCGGAVVLTDSVFWLILYPFLFDNNYRLHFLAASMHSFNAVFLVGDTILNNLKFPFFRIAYFILWTCTFVVFQWLFHAFVSTRWPYPFLDLSSRLAPIWYLGVGLLHLPCYGLFALVVKIKYCFLKNGICVVFRMKHCFLWR